MTDKTNLSLVLKERTKISEQKVDVDKDYYKLKLETTSGETKVAMKIPEDLMPSWMVDCAIESIIDVDFVRTQRTLQEATESENLDDGKNEKLDSDD